MQLLYDFFLYIIQYHLGIYPVYVKLDTIIFFVNNSYFLQKHIIIFFH